MKLPLADFGPVRDALRALGAAPLGVSDQEDTFFRHPQRDFAATDEALRLRSAAGTLELTYKGPKQAGAAKARLEQTVAVVEDPSALLASLGFQAVHRVRKRRESHRLDGLGVEVALDQVDGVGSYVEVEAMGTDAEEARRRMAEAVRRLGLDGVRPERRSYLEILLAAQTRV